MMISTNNSITTLSPPNEELKDELPTLDEYYKQYEISRDQFYKSEEKHYERASQLLFMSLSPFYIALSILDSVFDGG